MIAKGVPSQLDGLRTVASGRRRGAVLRGLVAAVVLVAGAALLVYGAAFSKRQVTTKEASTTVIPAKAPPAFLVDEARRRRLPPPPPEPARVVYEAAVIEWLAETGMVRDITVGALRREADGLHRLSLGDGPALCPT